MIFGELISQYWNFFKMGLVSALVLMILSYVSYLQVKVWTSDSKILDLQNQLDSCIAEKSVMEGRANFYKEVIKINQKYIQNWEPFRLKQEDLDIQDLILK
jgi:hypothetical protein